jgi:hypothetical protein
MKKKRFNEGLHVATCFKQGLRIVNNIFVFDYTPRYEVTCGNVHIAPRALASALDGHE